MQYQVRIPRWLAIILAVLTSIVLLGQIWPEGAPPFAKAVNYVVLIADTAVLLTLVRASSKSRTAKA